MRKASAIKDKLETPHLIPADTARRLDASLTKWFEQNQRDLKFRDTTDPYAIMVSEFMLQQTTVAAVEPYFARFIKSYPTVESLAAATEQEVMAMWAGLGYYRRARQLHAAAKTVSVEMAGVFPPDPKCLQNLPGFGRYTAGAVASQAFDYPAPILEANTVRVFARLAGIMGTTGESGLMKQLWLVSENLVSEARSPREFNRAAMELGALICRPNPDCLLCPVQSKCSAYNGGFAAETPRSQPRRANIDVEVISLAIRNSSGYYAVRQIPAGQWHAGLWEFPTSRVSSTSNAEAWIAELMPGMVSTAPEQILTLKYQVTHHKVLCSVFHCHVRNPGAQASPDDTMLKFLPISDICSLPLGSAQKKLLRYLETRHGRSED